MNYTEILDALRDLTSRERVDFLGSGPTKEALDEIIRQSLALW